MKAAREAAERFKPGGTVLTIRELGGGNVHDTYRVSLDSGEAPFVLQRMNPHVFPHAAAVMENIGLVTGHLRRKLESSPLAHGRRFEMPRVLTTAEGLDLWVDPDGFFWRAMSSIEGARALESIRDETQGEEVGWALGLFHRLISDLPLDRLYDTLPGFHETPRYLRRLDAVLWKAGSIQSPETARCLRYVERWRTAAGVLEEAKELGRLCPRPIHGDPKVGNFLADCSAGRVVSLIDLDTVRPGLVHYDVGDCLRSSCNRLGEDPALWESVGFDTDCCRALLKGYFSQGKDILTPADYEYIDDAAWLIPFELGIRFFTDHLEGNVYFKVAYPEHNLVRALVQFKLAESVEVRKEVIRGIVRDLRGAS